MTSLGEHSKRKIVAFKPEMHICISVVLQPWNQRSLSCWKSEVLWTSVSLKYSLKYRCLNCEKKKALQHLSSFFKQTQDFLFLDPVYLWSSFSRALLIGETRILDHLNCFYFHSFWWSERVCSLNDVSKAEVWGPKRFEINPSRLSSEMVWK